MSPRTKATGYRSSLTISRLIITLLAVATLAASCGRSAVDRELDRVDAVMESDPELADAMLDSILPGRGADRARHALYRLVATGKLTGAVDNDSLLTLVADRYCTPDAPATRDAMIANFYRGTAYMQKGDTPQAVRYLTAAEDIGETVADSIFRSRIYSSLTYLYSLEYNSVMEMEYALKTLHSIPSGDSLSTVDGLTMVAKAYSGAGLDSTACKYYDKALVYAGKLGDNVRYADILANYGVTKIRQKDFVSGIDMLTRATQTGPLPPAAAGAYAMALAHEGHTSAADEIMEEISHTPDSSALMHYLYYSALIAAERHDYATAYHNYRDLHELTVANLDRSLSRTVSESVKDYRNALFEEERRLYLSQKRIHALTTAIWIVVSLLLASLAYIIYRSYMSARKKAAYELQFMYEELQKARESALEAGRDYAALQEKSHKDMLAVQNDLVKAKEESSGYRQLYDSVVSEISDARYLQMKADDLMGKASSLSDTVADTLEELIRFYGDIMDEGSPLKVKKSIIKERVRHLNRMLFDNGPESVLFRYIDGLHDNLITHIREDLPGLSAVSMRIFALSVLGFSNSAISILLDEKYANTAQRKSRMKTELLQLPEPRHPGGYLIFFTSDRGKNNIGR